MMDELKMQLEILFSYNSASPWLFTHFGFWIFFTVLVGGYSLVYKHARIRNSYLLLFSLFFYFKTGGWFLTLLAFSAISNYIYGLIIAKSNKQGWRKVWLILGIFSNLLLLIYFKYAYFLTDLLNRYTGDAYEIFNWLAYWWNGLSASSQNVNEIILPVGISFFTFQAISYIVDVYRRDSEVVHNIFDFSFYLSFFPQLVAGPIVRASGFIPQLYRPYQISKREFGHALFLILAGLIKKMVISDYLSVNLVDRVFDNPSAFTGAENLLAVYGYALQIFCDFSGYTDIAIGVALMLGFKLPINFNSPYKALSLTHFWHRWHISLSTWLRDYLYIPLGGNRKGKARMYLALILTMLLGGLWHGAHLRFLLWGAMHGLVLVTEKMTKSMRMKFVGMKAWKVAGWFITFHVVCLGWIFFRAESNDIAQSMLYQIASRIHVKHFFEFALAFPKTILILIFGFIMHWLPFRFQELVRGKFIGLPLLVKVLLVLITVYILYLFLQADLQAFIYFRF